MNAHKALTIIKIGSLLTIASIGLFGITPAADATNINTHGVSCENYFVSQDEDIDHNPSGIRNISNDPRSVVCPISRSPLASGANFAKFFVDGSNPSGTSTTCTLYSHGFSGELLGTSTFTASGAQFDQAVNMPAWQVPTYAYVSALCTMPAGGMLLGITAVQ